MVEHLVGNGVPPSEYRAFHAPISGERRPVPFTLVHPREFCGQAIVDLPNYISRRWSQMRVEMRQAIALEDVIGGLPKVDLLDMDIQGPRTEVIEASIDLISSRVERVHIGTHGAELEDRIYRTMSAAGWRCRFRFPSGSVDHLTAAGPISFQDGVQSWTRR